MQRPRTDDLAAWPLAALMVVSGVSHFTSPGYFRELVPSWLPARAAVVGVSGSVDMRSSSEGSPWTRCGRPFQGLA